MSESMQNRIENRKDGMLLELIPEGEFMAGGDRDNEGGGPFPVNLSTFYLGLRPVTNAQYKKFVDESGHRPPDNSNFEQDKPVWKGNSFPKEKADHPVVCVCWYDAQAYCHWAGLRLPTELEWEKAVRGKDRNGYPWGNVPVCETMENPAPPTPALPMAQSWEVNPWGMDQMMDSVLQWCEDFYDSGAYVRYKQGDTSRPKSGRDRVLRGGLQDYESPGYFRYAFRQKCGPSYRLGRIGFRCART
jgi:formylglycine-generating enzyme